MSFDYLRSGEMSAYYKLGILLLGVAGSMAPCRFAAAQRADDDQVIEQAVEPVDRPNQMAVRDLAARLGMELRATADGNVVVAAVFPESKAAALGIRVGDVLKSIERQPITASVDAVDIIAADNPDKRISLAFNRDGRPLTLTTAFPDRVVRVQAAQNPSLPARAAQVQLFGLTAVENAQGQVVVVSVAAGSAAELAGVSPDDVLLEINDRPVTSFALLSSAASSLSQAAMPGDQVTIEAMRNRSDQTFVLILRERDLATVRAPIPLAETETPFEPRPVPTLAPPTAPAPTPKPVPRTNSPEPDLNVADLGANDNPNERVIFCMKLRRLASGSIVVTDVVENSPAALAGIRAGDALVSIQGEKIDSLAEFAQIIANQPAGGIAEFGVVRADRLGQIQVKLVPCEVDSKVAATEASAPTTATRNGPNALQDSASLPEITTQLRSLQTQVNDLQRAVQDLSNALRESQR
jgi:S1-C subfamily serine protease